MTMTAPVAMEREERFSNKHEALLAFIEGFQSRLWTSMPGIIVSYDAATQSASVQPAIQGRQRMPDLTWKFVDLPVLPDVPVQFPNGGGFTLTFPVQPGDECELHFSARCIDAWWAYGAAGNGSKPQAQVQAQMRMHTLSDAICFVGPRSLPRVLAGVSTTAAQLRSDDGATFVEVGPGSAVRVQADSVKSHARISYSWDVNGYGQTVTYQGSNTWHIDNYTTVAAGQTVTTTNHNISPPEAP